MDLLLAFLASSLYSSITTLFVLDVFLFGMGTNLENLL
jgi:hypothetical protein